MGQPVARHGDTVATGHGCDVTTTISDANTSSRVICEGEPVARVGDVMSLHTINNPAIPPPLCIPHLGAQVNVGSAKVLVGGAGGYKGIARLGDSADLGAISSACPEASVLAG
tara:strand:- start:78 stop:416 length:339 start_codon:yes stop_codon:yes gene_type:complete